ncbi:MAG: hypothetical protein HXY34_02165, partial [Candidatus Thorarchaeota archaeon]|nr:hypothetical protein [Candidatus Thorarchaeota archaeon]
MDRLNRERLVLVVLVVAVALSLLRPAAAVHEPTGVQANDGTVYSGDAQML